MASQLLHRSRETNCRLLKELRDRAENQELCSGGDPGWALGQGRLLPQPLGRILGVLTCWGAPSPPRTPAQGSSGESLLPSEEGTQGKKQSALAYKFITSDGFQE